MTWSSAKSDAQRMVAAILERVASLRAEHGEPSTIRLAIYPAPHDFRYLRPGDPWSWEHHTAVVRATARELKRHKLKIDLVECTADGCASWLDAAGMVNNTATRAAYVAARTN